jgi:hypothetical protein
MQLSALQNIGLRNRHRSRFVLSLGLALCSLAVGQTSNVGDAQRKAWPQEPEDFKGLKFGMTVDEVWKIMPFS